MAENEDEKDDFSKDESLKLLSDEDDRLSFSFIMMERDGLPLDKKLAKTEFFHGGTHTADVKQVLNVIGNQLKGEYTKTYDFIRLDTAQKQKIR